jgi:hypothetical protein
VAGRESGHFFALDGPTSRRGASQISTIGEGEAPCSSRPPLTIGAGREQSPDESSFSIRMSMRAPAQDEMCLERRH